MIDIPCQHKVSNIATCQQTGNLAILQRATTLVYHLVEKCVANSDKTYQDVVLFLELTWSFDIDRLSICEDYVGVVSKEEAQVVKILYFDKNKSSESDGRNSREDALRQRGLGDGFQNLFRRKLSSVISNQSTKSDQNRSLGSSQSQSRLSQLSSSRNSSNASPALSSSSLSRLGLDTYSYIKDDAHFVQWNFDDEEMKFDFENLCLSGPICRQSSRKQQKTVLFKGLQDLSNRDLLLADNPKIKDLRGE